MSNPLREFQNAILTRKVVARFVERVGMEHPSEEARKTYLKDHPDADPKNHSVKKDKGGGGGSGGGAEADVSKAESRSKETTKHFEDMKDLKKKVENADPSAKKKFDKAYDKLYESGEAASKAAEKLVKKFDGVKGEQAQSAVKLLHNALREWDRNKADHHKGSGGMAHQKLQQAEQTWAYAKKIDDQIKMLGKSLKGEYD